MTLSAVHVWPGMSTPLRRAVMVFIEAPWLGPWGDRYPSWVIPTAYLILLVPFCIASWLCEMLIIRSLNRALDRKAISRACLRANLASYALLALYPVSLYFCV